MKVEPVARRDPATCGVDDAIADHLRESAEPADLGFIAAASMPGNRPRCEIL